MDDTKKLTAEQTRALIRYALTIAQKVCHERFCDPHPMGQAEVCKATLEAVDLLNHYETTARKEARAAAFRDAVAIAEARCKDVPDSVDFEQDKNAFAAGYSVAAGSVKAGLERASKAG